MQKYKNTKCYKNFLFTNLFTNNPVGRFRSRYRSNLRRSALIIVAPVIRLDMALISVDHAGRHNPVRRKSPQATVGELAGHTLHKPARGGSLAREGPHHGRGLVHLTLLLLLFLKRNQGFFLHNVTHFFLSHFFILDQNQGFSLT